jgi:S1-C subfamily serine protease
MARLSRLRRLTILVGLAALAPVALSCDEAATRPAPGHAVALPAPTKLSPAKESAPAAPVKPAVIDDAQIARSLEAEANKLFDAGKTTPMKDLMTQLKNAKCDVTLAKPSGKHLSAAQVYERCRDSVVVMGPLFKCPVCGKNHVGGASGYFISESGIAVTNYHVVNNAKNLTLVAATRDGTVYPVKAVLAASAVNDVAIVQIDGSGFTPLPLVPDAAVGSEAMVISHPDGRFYTLSSGIVSRYGTIVRQRRKTPVMQITAEYARGSSGGPVLGPDGGVIGMVSSTVSVYYNDDHSKQQDLQMVVNECIPSAQILELINPQ